MFPNSTQKRRLIESVGYCYHFYAGPKWSYQAADTVVSYEEKGEWGVCRDADEREVADGEEGGQHGAKDDGGVDWFLPVVGTFEAHDELEVNNKYHCTLFLRFSFGSQEVMWVQAVLNIRRNWF